jgi:putative RNA 2'-phosphotransferase
VLRHNPASIGLDLQAGGWVQVTDLLYALAEHGKKMTPSDLVALVEADTKCRYTMADGRIRAAQGHSVEVDLGLAPATPPKRLFHGTSPAALRGIRRTGLKPGSRRHVHLSVNAETATDVGARRGDPVVVVVEAGRAHDDGVVFYLAENGVWLTESLDPRYLVFPEHQSL